MALFIRKRPAPPGRRNHILLNSITGSDFPYRNILDAHGREQSSHRYLLGHRDMNLNHVADNAAHLASFFKDILLRCLWLEVSKTCLVLPVSSTTTAKFLS